MRVVFLILAVGLSGCTEFQSLIGPGPDPVAAPAPSVAPRSTPRPPASRNQGPLPTTGQSVEVLDTTTEAERAAAAAAPPPATGATGAIGRTVAGLGDPARPGFWIETPLVTVEGPGRVVLASTGAVAQVKLIPADGPSTGGSRLSLATMRLLDAPLSDLVEIDVYSEG